MEPAVGADEIVVLRAQLHQANTTITAQKDLVQRMKTGRSVCILGSGSNRWWNRRTAVCLPFSCGFDVFEHAFFRVDINNLIEANRRGDAEYRKLQGALGFRW
jgi:hypothetical protein